MTTHLNPTTSLADLRVALAAMQRPRPWWRR